MQQLMKSVEENPKTEYSVDIESKTLTYGKREDRHRSARNLPHCVTTGIVGLHGALARQPRSGQEDRQETALHE